MATDLYFTVDKRSTPANGTYTALQFSDTNVYFVLTASTVETVTVPGNDGERLCAKFAYGNDDQGDAGNVWILPAAAPTLTLPTGTVTATLASLNYDGATVFAGQTLQLLTGQTGVAVSIAFYTPGN